jgi:hypothetical protein
MTKTIVFPFKKGETKYVCMGDFGLFTKCRGSFRFLGVFLGSKLA